jgi:hypothetical protein
MRKLSLLALALCLSLMVAAPAAAWEFGLTGKMTWDYRGATQLGNEGFFGPWNIDEAFRTGVSLGGVSSTNQNFWAGYLVMDPNTIRDIASTHSVVWNTYWMEFEPEIRLNPAVRIRSVMRIGSWRVPESFTGVTGNAWLNNPNTSNVVGNWGNTRQGAFEARRIAGQVPGLASGGHQMNGPAGTLGTLIPPWTENVSGFWLPNTIQSQAVVNWMAGSQISFSPIYVNSLWVTAQTPWGIIVFGKRPAPFGMGLIFDGWESSSESLALVAPYGPFRIGISYNPWNQGDPLSGLYGDWYNPYDAGNNRLISIAPFLTYENGPLSMGILVPYNFRHRDPEGTLPNNAAANQLARRDNVEYILSAFIKYNNGRFFFNGEVATYNRARYQQGNLAVVEPNPNGAVIAGFPANFNNAPWYIEDWRYAFETGCILGPAKVSILGAWLSGPDRRAGVLIDRIPMQFGNGTVLGNGSLFEPYSPIFVRNYGSGAGAYNVATRKGTGVDFRAIAGRVDYAVAANLNCYFSAWYAERNGSGYGYGWIRPEMNWSGVPGAGIPSQPLGRTNTATLWNTPVIAAVVGGNPALAWNWGTDGLPAPTIPTADLGWELNAGWNWQLLEGLECTGDFGVWWPGQWFSYACVSRANPGWQQRTQANTWGTSPGRYIDPVFLWSVKLVTAF